MRERPRRKVAILIFGVPALRFILLVTSSFERTTISSLTTQKDLWCVFGTKRSVFLAARYSAFDIRPPKVKSIYLKRLFLILYVKNVSGKLSKIRIIYELVITHTCT